MHIVLYSWVFAAAPVSSHIQEAKESPPSREQRVKQNTTHSPLAMENRVDLGSSNKKGEGQNCQSSTDVQDGVGS